MVYCSGLPSNLTQEDIKSNAYFGQYGKVDKIVMNPYPNRNYCSVYLTFSHEFEAATAILVDFSGRRPAINFRSATALFGACLAP